MYVRVPVEEKGCYVIYCSLWGQVRRGLCVCVCMHVLWGWNIHDHLECIMNVNGDMWEHWKWKRSDEERNHRKREMGRETNISTSVLVRLSLFIPHPSFSSSLVELVFNLFRLRFPSNVVPPSTCSYPAFCPSFPRVPHSFSNLDFSVSQ